MFRFCENALRRPFKNVAFISTSIEETLLLAIQQNAMRQIKNTITATPPRKVSQQIHSPLSACYILFLFYSKTRNQTA
ncbi:hypothetical protein L596_024245 [Steinernema carpocapsae]|uniref:Uncharacterized protein n=1 Tax=Steinernema carpocapsae TaxID=34508 RepID=A0A4U5MG68_STECR|nr:hypothetical protein L596_024245 [Steinernema carpocapsae]